MGYHEVSVRGFLRGLTTGFVLLLDDDLLGRGVRIFEEAAVHFGVNDIKKQG